MWYTPASLHYLLLSSSASGIPVVPLDLVVEAPILAAPDLIVRAQEVLDALQRKGMQRWHFQYSKIQYYKCTALYSYTVSVITALYYTCTAM